MTIEVPIDEEIDEQKYIVFKREDLFSKKGFNMPIMQAILEAMAVPDAVVIRRQDVFAAAGLYAYANGIHTALDISRGLSEEERTHMRALADFFSTQAVKSEADARRMPD